MLLREVEATGGVSLPGFWGPRIRRLLPALAVMLVGVTVLANLYSGFTPAPAQEWANTGWSADQRFVGC